MDTETDVLIAGAGMAGLTAGVTAAETGATVTILEKAPRPGGSMAISGGNIWTLDSLKIARDRIPHGSTHLQSTVIDQLPEALSWLAAHGVHLRELSTALPGFGNHVDTAELTSTLIENLTDNDGTLHLETSLERLTTTKSGDLTGAIARHQNTCYEFDTNAIILATGGFQGNEQLLQQYITEHPEHLWLRSNPWSTGDGLTAATAIGAKVTTGLGTFYGHSLPAPPASFHPTEFTEVTQFYGPWAIALNRQGRRFTDESQSQLEETLTQAIAKHANGRAWYIFDNDLYNSTISTGKSVKYLVDQANDAGGRVTQQPTIEALCATLGDWGVHEFNAHETISTYTEAIQTGKQNHLDPPREAHHHAIETPPFHAVEVQPGITFTMGGLDVNERMNVIHRSSSTSTIEYYPESPTHTTAIPIPNLFAAGVDVGNINHQFYMGGLAPALVTGRIAGASAASCKHS